MADGDVFQLVWSHGADPDFVEFSEHHPLPRNRDSLVGRVALDERTQQIADVLADPERTKGMTPTLTASAGSITFMRTFAVPERKAFRVLFELDPQWAPSSELRLVLEAGGKRISETWLYRWTPT